MNKSVQRGFTLIELVVVITILGILAAFAVPRFMSMDKAARVAFMQGLEGSVKSASALAHGAYLANGGVGNSVPVEGTTIGITLGYPSATAAGIGATIQDGSGTSWKGAYAGGVATFTKVGAAAPATCSFTYTAPTLAGNPPVISVLNQAGC